jgi:hypothetical protein
LQRRFAVNTSKLGHNGRKSMQILDKIGADVVKRASVILTNQSFVPVSPADYDEKGRVCLCAAGILAKAGLEILQSATRAEQFEGDVARTGDKDLLYSAFETLGWSAHLCREMVNKNDMTAPELRPTIIQSRLWELS